MYLFHTSFPTGVFKLHYFCKAAFSLPTTTFTAFFIYLYSFCPCNCLCFSHPPACLSLWLSWPHHTAVCAFQHSSNLHTFAALPLPQDVRGEGKVSVHLQLYKIKQTFQWYLQLLGLPPPKAFISLWGAKLLQVKLFIRSRKNMQKCSTAGENYAYNQIEQTEGTTALSPGRQECHGVLGGTVRAAKIDRVILPPTPTSRTSGIYFCSCAT